MITWRDLDVWYATQHPHDAFAIAFLLGSLTASLIFVLGLALAIRGPRDDR